MGAANRAQDVLKPAIIKAPDQPPQHRLRAPGSQFEGDMHDANWALSISLQINPLLGATPRALSILYPKRFSSLCYDTSADLVPGDNGRP